MFKKLRKQKSLCSYIVQWALDFVDERTRKRNIWMVQAANYGCSVGLFEAGLGIASSKSRSMEHALCPRE